MVQVAYSLRPIDGGANYFAQFSKSLPTDPNFFPVGAWLEGVQTQSDINLDKAAGLNMYVGITANSNFSLIQNSGMYVIAQADELKSNQTIINNSSTAGWLLHDEIDMQLGPGAGYTTLNNIKASLPNDGRMDYNNYGKGVLFWETDAEAARFVNSVDVVSADAYWFTDPHISSGGEGGALLNNGNPLTASQTRLAANYGYTVDRVQELDATDGVIQPVWAFVEVGWPWTETAAQGARQIQPAEIQAAVWQSIIAGAQGIIYFNHSFGGPEPTQNVLRDPAYAAQLAAVTQTDALIKQLAPVLNSPFDDAFVSVNSSVRAMSKYYGGEHYVFAGSTVNGASTAPDTFTLAGISSGTAVVVGESRTITITNGQFSDNFADGNAIHIYHIIADGTQTAPSAPTAPTTPSAPTIPSAPSGNSNFNGGPGNDKISFNFNLTDATVSFSGNHVIVDGPSGSHTVLTGFKTYVFTDGTVNDNDGDPLVDDLFYYSHNHDVWNAHVDADQHYHQSGWHEGRDPNSFFSTSFYLSLNQDVKQAGADPLVHFHQFGWQEGRQPSAAFDDAAYLAANPDVAAAHVDPLAHFLQSGEGEGRQPTALTSLIGPHGFDYIYYLQHNPDVQAAKVDPFQHYENFGWKEGRDPNAQFDTNGYLAANPDVANAHINPLDHYDQYGWREGRDPSPAFDTTDYLSHYPDVAAAHIDPLTHYLQFGIHEGRQSFGHAIPGSTGNDILKGTPGSDLFVGNGGQDTFVFAANFGHDVIRDFGALGQSHDVLEFSKSVFDSFASVLSHASQVGPDVVISAGSDTLLLKNTKLGALDSPDFHFA